MLRNLVQRRHLLPMGSRCFRLTTAQVSTLDERNVQAKETLVVFATPTNISYE